MPRQTIRIVLTEPLERLIYTRVQRAVDHVMDVLCVPDDCRTEMVSFAQSRNVAIRMLYRQYRAGGMKGVAAREEIAREYNLSDVAIRRILQGKQ